MKKFRPGLIFGDHMERQSTRVKTRSEVDSRFGVRLHKWLGVGMLMAMGLLMMRLISLQLIQGGKMRVLANENRIRQVKAMAARGKIYDRNGVVLADNRQVVKINQNQLPEETWQRLYPFGPAFGHVVGYVGEVSENEVGLLGIGEDKYRSGDIIGRGGLELQYEQLLRGRDGGRLVEVDSQGEVAREMGKKIPVSGENLTTTLDSSLQTTAYQALDGRKGAVVATHPKTGEVLVLTSSPGFDPLNLADSLENADQPLLNRSIGGMYAPGSVFKMVTTLAALESGRLNRNFTMVDTGSVVVGDFSYTNWYFTQYGGVEGVTDWVKALARSVDTFYYKVGEEIGPEIIADWAQKIGYGAKTGIDLPEEAVGLVPTPDWKEKTLGERWFLGNTYHLAIGQSDLLATPVQVNLMTGIIAAGGRKCTPFLNKALNIKCGLINISPEVLSIVKRGMENACRPGGTAFPLFDFPPGLPAGRQVACKTGTAEYVRPDGKIGAHAWLTAYAPADDPTIAITAVVEGGGEGSRVAAPIVRKVLAKYFGVEDNFNYAAVSGVGE